MHGLRAISRRHTIEAMPRVWTRCIGESTGLKALADRSSSVRRHDALGPGTVGDTQVESYASWGFTVNGVAIRGPVLLLPRACFLFKPQSLAELTPKSLLSLDLLETPLSMLILGCGRQSRRMPASVRAWLEERGASAEALATAHACSTFNFMVQEQRSVAAVLWPLAEPNESIGLE